MLPADPTLPLQAATKQYVDSKGLMPVGFPFNGKPAASLSVFIPVTIPISIAANLVGSVGYANTVSTGGAVFTLSKISGGSTTALGTITATAGSKTAFVFAGAGGTLVVGDTLQLTAPASQDATLADLGITIHAVRT